MILTLASWVSAHPYAEEAVTADPPGCEDRGARWLRTARAYTDEAQPAAARQALAEAARCGAEPAVVAAHEALVASAFDDPARALSLLDEAIRDNPQHLGLRIERAQALAALALHEAALEDFAFVADRIQRPEPDVALAHARSWLALGEHREALAVLDTAIERIGPAPALVETALEIEIALGSTAAALGRLAGLPDRPPWRARRAQIAWMAGLGGSSW